MVGTEGIPVLSITRTKDTKTEQEGLCWTFIDETNTDCDFSALQCKFIRFTCKKLHVRAINYNIIPFLPV